MRGVSIFAAAALGLALAVSAAPASANPGLPRLESNVQSLNPSLAEPAQYRRYGYRRGYGGYRPRGGYCRSWRRECSYRWGWGSWRFQRCMARHGC
jgi:hypothetical protein